MYLPYHWATIKLTTAIALLGLPTFASMAASFAQAQTPAPLAEIKVTDTQSAAPFAAQLTQLTNSTISLAVGGESRDVPITNLRKVEFRPVAPVAPASYSILLRDGSSFSAATITSDGQVTRFSLSDSRTLEVPTKLISDIRLRVLTEAQRDQWQAIRDSRLSADMLVLVRSEESLDKIEGTVNRIADESVEFEFGGQTIPAPFSKLAGIRLYAKSTDSDAKLAAVVRDAAGNVWNAAQVSATNPNAGVELVLRGGLTLSIPTAQLLDIDYAVGSTKYVAEMQPVARSTEERFPLAIPVAGSDSLFGARVASGQKFGPSIEFLGGGSTTYRIPAEFTRLLGEVVLDPPGDKITPCIVQIMVEKKTVWEQRLTNPKQSVPVDLPVIADQRIQLVVKPQSDLPVGDVVIFRELRLLK